MNTKSVRALIFITTMIVWGVIVLAYGAGYLWGKFPATV